MLREDPFDVEFHLVVRTAGALTTVVTNVTWLAMSKRDEIETALRKLDEQEMEKLVGRLRGAFPLAGGQLATLGIGFPNPTELILRAVDADPNVESVLCGVLGISRPRDDDAHIARRALTAAHWSNGISVLAALISLAAVVLSIVL